MPIDKILVKEGDKEQPVFIAMTEEEANDRSYREYLKEAETEKTKEYLRKKLPREKSSLSRNDQILAIKEMRKYRDGIKKREGSKKYF